MPITIPSNRTITLASKAGGGFQSAGLVGGGAFTPLIAEDSAGQTAGQTNSDWTSAAYSNVTAKSGTISTRLLTDPGQPPSTCGGSVDFGGRRTLPITIPVGKTIWQRIYFYLPSTFSMGYLYDSGDFSGEALTCGKQDFCDGGPANLKWMVLAPDVSTARAYFQPYVQKRQAAQAATPGLRVITEVGPDLDEVLSGQALPRDQWFCIEMALKVSKTSDGYIRAWIDGQLVAEVTGVNTIASNDTGIREFGIGPYWNGLPWTDGTAGRDTFYIDEVIVASDADGYGAPTALDASGNAFIGPTTLVGDL